MKNKVSIIGSGFVGTMTAQRIAERDLADVVLVDIIEGVPQGRALDIAQSSSLEGFDIRVTGTNDYADIEQSDIVVITAGFPRTPGMSREELGMKNGTIIKSVGDKIKEHAPDCILIIVTNPLDVMTQFAWQATGFAATKVMGMGGVLDTARYKYFLAKELDISAKDIEALVLGSHGDTMVPVDRYTTVKGIPISQFIPRERIDAILERTKYGGAEIVKLLKNGSAWHAPSSSIVLMVDAILNDRKRIVTASAYVEGTYGIHDTFIGVPVRLGAAGIEEILEIDLTDDERAALQHSAGVVKNTLNKLKIL